MGGAGEVGEARAVEKVRSTWARWWRSLCGQRAALALGDPGGPRGGRGEAGRIAADTPLRMRFPHGRPWPEAHRPVSGVGPTLSWKGTKETAVEESPQLQHFHREGPRGRMWSRRRGCSEQSSGSQLHVTVRASKKMGRLSLADVCF